MQEIKRTSVHDFIYNTIAGTQEISIIGAHNQYVKEPFYDGTPNDLFENHIDIANELKGWIAGSIWVDNAGVLVITADGGRTEQWLSDYGKSVANVRASSEYPQGYVKVSSDNSDQDYETRLDGFMEELERTPMIRRNTYAIPIHIGVYDGTIQISSNIDMANAIATVERLGAKYNVIEPNSAYAKDDYTLVFALNRDSQQSPEYINSLG